MDLVTVLRYADNKRPEGTPIEKRRWDWEDSTYPMAWAYVLPCLINRTTINDESQMRIMIAEMDSLIANARAGEYLERIALEVNRTGDHFRLRVIVNLTEPDGHANRASRRFIVQEVPPLTVEQRATITETLIECFWSRGFEDETSRDEGIWKGATQRHVVYHIPRNVVELERDIDAILEDGGVIELNRECIMLKSPRPDSKFSRRRGRHFNWSVEYPAA